MTKIVPIIFAAATLLIVPPDVVSARDHPSLVNPATAKCATCHETVLFKSVKHPAALDGGCTTCHAFDKSGGKTTVSLSAADPQLCLTCHDALAKAAAGTVAAPHAPVTSACTSCHGPHSTDDTHLLTSSPPALCLTCHDATEVNQKHRRSVSNADCRQCHAPHGSENKKMMVASHEHPPFAERSCESCHRQGTIARAKPKNNVCFACHDEKSFQAQFVHTAVKQGKCAGCHDPHLSERGKFVKAEGPALCTGCHPAIRAKIELAGAHPPATDSCTTCHDPHKGSNPQQLTDAVPALCITCHDATDKVLAKKHLGADMTKAACLGCHDPHGSATRPLMVGGSVHPPFGERSCNSCHKGESATTFLAATKTEVCVACHPDVDEKAAKAKTHHPALDAVECTECHSPHASRQQRLIRLPGGGECTACHTEKAIEPGGFAHGAIAFLGCRSCHEPHGSDQPRLLRAEGDKLCLGCHEAGTRKTDETKNVILLDHFSLGGEKAAEANRMSALTVVGDHIGNHPLGGHRATGKPTPEELKRASTTFDGELGCLTCHDPHKGRARNHFKGNVATAADLCLTCHKK